MQVAVLDIGTNAVRYLLTEWSKGDWRDIDFGGAITGLGRGLGERGELAPIAMEATLGAASAFGRRLKALGANKLIVLATEAVRSATNGSEFLQRLEQVTGVSPRVLSDEEEARLAFIGATSGLRMGFRTGAIIAVADVGGGSTEFAIGKQQQPERWMSIPIGSRRLTEQFLTDDLPTTEQLDAAYRFAFERLQPAAFLLRDAEVLLLAGGTACALGTLRLQLKRFEPKHIHGLPIRTGIVREWLEKLAAMPAEERRKVEGMEWGRENIIVAGLLLLLCVMEIAEKGTALLSARSVLHGALLTASLMSLQKPF